MFTQLTKAFLEQHDARPPARCACLHPLEQHDPNPTEYTARSGRAGRGRKCRVEECACTHYHPKPRVTTEAR